MIYVDAGLVIGITIVLIITIFAYIRLAYPFWSIQPVYHTYDIQWSLWKNNPITILRSGDPVLSKYYDKEHVMTKEFLEIDAKQLSSMIDILQCHYIRSDRILNSIDGDTLSYYLTGHHHPAYVSLYLEDKYEIVHNEGQMSEIKRLPFVIGTMTSKPVKFFVLDRNGTMMDHTSYFWDYICEHREYASRNISRYMIQTHLYHQRIKTPEIKTGIFRKEEILCKGVVPLVNYTVSTFVLRKIRAPPLPPHFTVVRIFNENQDILSDFLYGISHSDRLGQSLFSVCTFPEIGSIITLIQQQIWYVYALKRNNQIYAIYFLKDTNMIYEDMTENATVGSIGYQLECMASVSNMMSSGSNGLFFSGFLHTLRDIVKYGKRIKKTTETKGHFNMIAFSDIAHNPALLEKWRWKYTPVFETPSAYYAYNMIISGMPIAKQSFFALL